MIALSCTESSINSQEECSYILLPKWNVLFYKLFGLLISLVQVSGIVRQHTS